MKTSRILLVACGIGLCLAGCATRPVEPTVRIVTVPSSKPYKFISLNPKKDSAFTKAQIRAHNRAHQAVIDQEKSAKQ